MKAFPINTTLPILIALTVFSCLDQSDYGKGLRSYEEGSYKTARIYLKNVESSDANYENAQMLLGRMDSMNNAEKMGERLAILDQTIKQLKLEIESVDDFKVGKNGTDLNGVTLDLTVLSAWANLIKEAKATRDDDAIELARQLEESVKMIQTTAFPQLRKNYGDVMREKLWIENIEVSTIGSGHGTLELVGGVFASNRSIAETQQTLSDMLLKLRFRRVQFKWIPSAEKYTYYEIESSKDNEIVSIE